MASRSIVHAAFRAGLALAVVATGSTAARAGTYEEDQNAKHMGVIERTFDKYVKDPAIFDGKAIKAGVSAGTAEGHAQGCDHAIRAFDQYYPQISTAGQGTDRAHKLVDRYNELAPWCKKLGKAAAAHIAAIEAAAEAAEKDAAERSQMCRELSQDAWDATGSLQRVLDIWAGNMTPSSAEDIKAFRTQVDGLVKVCSQRKYAGATERCRGADYLTGGGNARYDYGDICTPAVDPAKTMTDVVMRSLDYKAHGPGGKIELPTAASLRNNDGWLQSTDVVAYATYFEIDQADKDKRTAEVKELFAAAGVAAPADLSVLWADQQAYRDALKVAVDTTAGEWKLSGDKCKGYACKNAEKQVKKYQKKAKIKKVIGWPWKIVKNSVGLPTYRYMSMHVLYQIPGEPYCQLRSLTANENYKGGGKYQKATGAQWGFVRFQKCK